MYVKDEGQKTQQQKEEVMRGLDWKKDADDAGSVLRNTTGVLRVCQQKYAAFDSIFRDKGKNRFLSTVYFRWQRSEISLPVFRMWTEKTSLLLKQQFLMYIARNRHPW